MEKATIGLSIIVKNEEKVIRRLLESIYPILDWYTVVDTGSTDRTKEIVKEFFDEKNIPGEIIDHEWVNFGKARMCALEAVKGKADFGFWIDADEQIEYDKNFNVDVFKTHLNQVDQAAIEVNYNNTRYTRAQFWRTSEPFYWYGPVHEIILCENKSIKSAVIHGMTVIVTPDGNSWTSQTQQEKYEKDARLLEEYVANDPKKDPRWVFYLAQSYRDAVTPENKEKSIKWYQKRANMEGGYQEERYFSQLMVANLKASLGTYTFAEVLAEFVHCANHDPLRAEHFNPIISTMHNMKMWESAYIFSKHAYTNFHKKNPYPKRSLFIDPTIYDWRLADLHAISCHYTRRHDEAKTTFNQLLKAVNKGLVDEKESKRIKSNMKFFKSNGK